MASFIFGIQELLKQLDIRTYTYGEEKSFRVHASTSGNKSLSLWHDIPLYPTPDAESHCICNMVNEIPKFSRKKFEIATNEPGNPIKQDIKKGELREFLKGDLYFNYGCLPRTWEDPDHEHPDAKAKGDNDPLDVCEIGLRRLNVAEVTPVKILGCLCLIDEGEADWKLIAISIADPWAEYLNDVDDLEQKLPGVVDSIREWFRTYKIPDGKPENKFGLDGRCMNAAYAMAIVRETHESWQNLVTGKKETIYCEIQSNTDVQHSKYQKVRATDLPNSSNIVKNLSYPKLSIDDLASVEPFSPSIKEYMNNKNDNDTYSNISDKSGHEENKAPSF